MPKNRGKIMSQRTIIFFTCLTMVAEIRAQCDRPNVGGNIVLNAESDKRTYDDNSTAKFKCSVGYKPIDPTASDSILCKGNQWTELKLKCQRKSCGSLGEIPNGRYQYDGIEFGQSATAECNIGYVLVGEKTRYCRDAGWDGRDPVCEVVKCSEPPKIINGRIEDQLKEEYEYSEAVTYSCENGFTPNGTLTISCSADGTFQPSPPHCIIVTCNEPDVQNGRRISVKPPPYGNKHYVEFECNRGHRMVGESHLTCGAMGWNPHPPKCIPFSTPRPTTATPTTTPPSNMGLKLGFGLGIPIFLVVLMVVFFIKNSRKDHSVKVPTTNEDIEY